MDESVRRTQEIAEKNLVIFTHEDGERLYAENEKLKKELECVYANFENEKLERLQDGWRYDKEKERFELNSTIIEYLKSELCYIKEEDK